MQAVVNWPVCPLCAAPEQRAAHPELSCLEDEVLFGMLVTITGDAVDGWVPVTTAYRYSGWAPQAALVQGDAAQSWQAATRQVVLHKNFADVLVAPKVQAATLVAALPRGARVAVQGDPVEGWQPVLLPDGKRGYIAAAALGTLWQKPCVTDTAALRTALIDAARLYTGTQYRWGGKTPAGIDCSGLCSMAYLLCGITIYRDAAIADGFPIQRIPLSEMRPADLIYFPGHIAMYLGGGLYIHSTARAGDGGVTINSFDKNSPLYRADLPAQIKAVGSYF